MIYVVEWRGRYGKNWFPIGGAFSSLADAQAQYVKEHNASDSRFVFRVATYERQGLVYFQPDTPERRGNNRDVSAERCTVATSQGRLDDMCEESGPRVDAGTPAGSSIAFPRNTHSANGEPK